MPVPAGHYSANPRGDLISLLGLLGKTTAA